MDIFSEDYAKELDQQDPLRSFRDDFIIPSKEDLHRKTLASTDESAESSEPCTYLCGNSLGLQPKLTAQYTQRYHQTWATKGVYGHFTEVEDSPLVPWLHVDDDVMEDMGKIIGAQKDEVAVMQTLTGNLHLAMSSFYRPTKERYKIILEGKAFPSDHYAVESQIRNHGLDPKTAMLCLVPNTPMRPTLSTQHICRVIDQHAAETALLLLPGVQFYTGQFFDIATITAHAQKRGIVVGWDLAHAVGNVPLKMHDWNVDFAVWCTYKYLNCGPGCAGGLFIHERHGQVTRSEQSGQLEYRPRLAGWWGSEKGARFRMENKFKPITGAAGWQLSNPSVADLTAVRASLDVFKKTSMQAVREKSIKLTKYLEDLLRAISQDDITGNGHSSGNESHPEAEKVERGCFEIITPSNPKERGAQLSLRLAPGLLEPIIKYLDEQSVVTDERRPDVIRVAPAPLYNNWSDVLRFVEVFRAACIAAVNERKRRGSVTGVSGGVSGALKKSLMAGEECAKKDKIWSEV